MCGIAGFTHLDGERSPERILAATLALKHRGPDQHGAWESDSISLGAVRLKILDLAGGDQPIVFGDTVIVFNGEIYNHLDVRRELEQRGHKFESHCDTETVLHAFVEWDTACFERLRGMFAVALWNERDRRLILARDRMGIKPLYTYLDGADLCFGSELKSLFEMPGVWRTLDPMGLAVYLTRNYPAPDRTLLEGVRKLTPGSWLEWRGGRMREGRYWNPAIAPRDPGELDGLLREAIREHLLSDVPLGVWASGGLDSSTVLHYAAEAVPKLKTFSVSFVGRKFDESRWFREVARHYGTDHHEFDLNPERDIADVVQKLPYYSDEPSADAGAVPVYYLSKMCRSQVTVALSGEGADELFGGYKTYAANEYASAARIIPAPLRRATLFFANLLPPSDEKIGFEYKLKRFLEGSLLAPTEAHFFWNGTFRNGELMPRFDIPETRDYMLLDQENYLAEDILNKCDRMSMAHSLEVRPPFLDHRLVEFARGLPANEKRDKKVLRYLMRGKLPESVLTRPKEGFDIPVHQWFRTVLRELLMDTLADAPSVPFDMARVRRVAEDHLARRANYGYHLWGLLILFLWMKRWNVVTN
ncbi:MAG: asparagine synthase (glutamine-hydrolyzing) [Bryobacteraceae bacterium]|nr:asparagine synthase (glutamine-hydrolyzing) [Bryobacteraceae bacterium]